MKKIIMLSGLMGLILSSCYYNSEETVYPVLQSSISCDTTSVTYSVTVKKIMDDKCNTCHSSSKANSQGGGIVLDDYSNVNSYKDIIIHAIKQDVSYVSKMPKNGGKLSDCDINKFQIWINKGALNN